MPILSEDVIIRLLVDTNKGVADLKKAETGTKNLAKQAVSMASAMGGAALAIELVVKAFTALIEYTKEAEKAYVEMIKASDDYAKGVYSEIDAIDDLEAAKQHMKEVNGALIAQSLEGVRARRAENIETRIAFREQATLEQKVLATGIAFFGSSVASIRYKDSIVDATTESNTFSASLNTQVEALNQASSALDRYYGVRESSGFGSPADMAAKAAAAKAIADAQIALQEMEMENYAAIIAEENRLKDIKGQNALYLANLDRQTHDAKMAQIEAEKMLQINAALTVAGVLNNLIGAAFGDSKAAAIAQATINSALAITRLYIDLPIWAALAATPLVIGTMAAQISKINQQSFATGTPPGGYVVPSGYEGDNFPVSASSGETVTVSRPGQSEGQMLYASLSIDGYQFGKVVTRLFADRKAVISGVTA